MARHELDSKLTLDHLTPHSHGGQNHEHNLITACERCNKSRGNRSVDDFAAAVADYLNHGVEPSEITGHISDCTPTATATHGLNNSRTGPLMALCHLI